ncbi:MAG: ATP-binding protein [Thermoleophilia bacterium]
MALVLAATALFVYVRLGRELTRELDEGLRSRVEDVRVLVAESPLGAALAVEAGSPLVSPTDAFAQVLDPSGAVRDATTGIDEPLLGPRDLASALAGPILVGREGDAIPTGAARLLASPVEVGGEPFAVVVGASLERRHEALTELRNELIATGLAALLATSVASYLLAASALRPVERMRRRAAAISGASPGERLPVPEARDEIARLGDTLNAMLARLEDALARERRVVSDASHELRTPLALLKVELELALARPRSPAELEAALRSAAEETDRLARLAEDLLVLARADQGQLPLRPTLLDATALLGAVADRFGSAADAAGRALVVAPGEPIGLEADDARLEQAVGNLVDNALRHGAGTVSLSARRVGDRVELHVEDEGSGLPKAFLPRAFERFSRADEARSAGGSGLGLALVAVVAAAHGGVAHVRNRPAGGADAWIELPVR